MSDSSLKRIEKSIARLCEQQAEVGDRIANLEREMSALRAESGAGREETLRFLDQFRAG